MLRIGLGLCQSIRCLGGPLETLMPWQEIKLAFTIVLAVALAHSCYNSW